MNDNLNSVVDGACKRFGNDRTRMLDIVNAVQADLGSVPGAAMERIAQLTGTRRVEVESVVSFYAFLSIAPKGRTVIRLCSDVIDRLHGMDEIARVIATELGLSIGQTSADGAFTLEWTPCIGLSDQAPAAMVNNVMVTHLTVEKARAMVEALKKGEAPAALVKQTGDGNNAHPLVRSMVTNNIREKGPVIFSGFESGSGLHKALVLTPAEVIRDIKTARLRGRGGAGFPTGMKWEFTRQAAGTRRFVICNADEGEPGTFKDRVILTEAPDLMIEGMTIAGYAIGAETGIIYLRAEYAYLKSYLESILDQRRRNGLLGRDIGRTAGFNFDIRIQMGAGAYVCGEETSLLSSCEGLRGDPRTRPPFPAEKGYLASPTAVNNVETFCCVARILDHGPGWFASMGSKGSPGTKLFSVSGDCRHPGVYELPFGTKLADLLEKAGADNPLAVQVGGASGQMIGRDAFERSLCYDDLATGGSIMIFGANRDLLQVASDFMAFFVHESCGYCTPCRVGNVLIKERLDRIVAGQGQPEDLPYLQQLCETVRTTSRCGLGQTSASPVLSTLKNFRSLYEAKVRPAAGESLPAFDIKAALVESESLTGRKSVIF